MNEMVRKNIHIPDEVVLLIGDVLHNARYRSETAAVVAMLEGASDRLREVGGYVYLMEGEKGLKIGTSIQPNIRAASLKSKLLYCITGDRLTELSAHMIWGRYRVSGEWFSDRKEIRDWFSGHTLSVDLDDVVDAKTFSTAGAEVWQDALTKSEHHELELARLARDAASQMVRGLTLKLKNRCIKRLHRRQSDD